MMPSAKRRTPSVSAFIKSLDNIDEDCNNDDIEDAIDEEATIYVVEQDVEVSQHERYKESEKEENVDLEEIIIAEPTRYELISDEDYVDLGLSVKWASKNVGANNRLELGNKYSAMAADTNMKWNTIPENIATSEFDIANRLSNGRSMIPTKKQWKELIDKCEWHWADVNGVVGYRVIGRNGNSIFLPSTGNDNACYWSATKASKYKCFYYLYFNSYNYDIMYNLLTGHNYIRPVEVNSQRNI